MTKSTLGMSKPLLATSVARSIGTLPDLNLHCKLRSEMLLHEAWIKNAYNLGRVVWSWMPGGSSYRSHCKIGMTSPSTFQVHS